MIRRPTIHCMVTFLLAFTVIIPAIIADQRNPLKDPRSCGRPECELIKSKFHYKPANRYKYEYQAHVRSEFVGSGQNTSDVFITATLLLSFPRNCEGILTIYDVELREESTNDTSTEEQEDNDYNDFDGYPSGPPLHPNSEQFGIDISKYELRFSFNDGIISEICPADLESNWVLNFKKGILSALQNSMNRFDMDVNATETDVSGTCDVAYTLTGAAGTSLLIQKTKDISSCINRYETKSILQTTPYDFRKKFAIWPILNSSSICNISIDHNIYQDVSCYERHQLVPFSNNQNGAVTESKQKLLLIEEISYESSNSYDEDELYINKRTSLLFNHNSSPKPTHGEIKASRDLLKQLCKLGFPNIRRDFIDFFVKFLQATRNLQYSALEQLLARAESICTNGKNHVLESLPYIGSTASVILMKDQIVKNAVQIDTVYNWLSSLIYLPRPDEQMLEAFYDLIVYGKTSNDPIYTLPTTAAIHTFCRNIPDCDSYSNIRKIIDFLMDDMNLQLTRDLNYRPVRQRVLTILKGIGNIGISTSSIIDSFKHIILNKSIPIDVRIETIYAYRRFDCMSSRDYFLDIYRNFDENSELRIASYLQAMRCPDYAAIKTIKFVLVNEEINQVGSFVWSHLKNLAKSASPVHVEAQGLLVEDDLGTKYKLDIRKFSKNFEHSLFFDEYNIGANSDMNLIFGTDSYMPRYASLNFTTDLFGESINFFELSTRMEGFEHMIESIFGPKGPLNTKKFMDKFNGFTKYFRDTVTPEDFEYLENGKRKKRETDDTDENISENEGSDQLQVHSNANSINNFEPQHNFNDRIESLNYNMKYNFDKPRAAFGLKIFGNSIFHKSIEGIDEIVQAFYQLNPYNQLKNLFSGKDITYTKSGILLDASYDVSLGCGLPLSIHAFGASSIDLRMSGSLKGNFHKPFNLNVKGKLKPSISVDVIGSMQFDYFYGTSGIRVKSNFYSSSAVDAKIVINETNFASIQFNLPQDRNDIFSVRSELLVIKYDKEIEQNGIEKRDSNATCTWPFIDRAVGLKICADYSLPDVSNGSYNYPSLILSGPIYWNLYLNKADLSAKVFLFEYNWKTMENGSIGSIVFHTPESSVPRILMGQIINHPNQYNLSMSFRNGNTYHSAVGMYKNTRDDKRIEIYLNLDGQKNFALEMEMTRSELKYGWVYYPKFLLSVNNDQIAGLSGTLKATNKKNILQYDVNFNFETKKLKTKLAGYIIQTEVSISTKMQLEYMFLENTVESVEIEGELSNRSQRSRTEYLGALKLNSTAYKQFSFTSNLSFVSLLGHIETNIHFNNAPDLIDPNHTCSIRLMFARYANDPKKLEGLSTEGLVEIKRPKSNVDWKFFIRYEERTRKGLEHNVHIELQYAPGKKATTALSILFPRGPLFSVDGMLNITVPTFESCTVSLKLIEKVTNEYTIDFKGALFTGHSMSIKGIYQDKSSAIKKYQHLKIVAKSPYFEDTFIKLRYWRDEVEISFNLQVDYAKQPYALLLKYSERQENKKISSAEIKFRDKTYSILASLMSEQPKQINIEIHMDKVRDVHLVLRSVSTDRKKEALMEIKWDANRDPTEKLAISAEFNHPKHRNYDGNFVITYPDRTFSGTFALNAAGPVYTGIGHVSWNTYESIQIQFNAGTKFSDEKDLWISLKINTPFEGWKSNSIGAALYKVDNLLMINSSLEWADDQNLAVALMGDYKLDDPILKIELKFDLNSTVKDVPTALFYFKHFHDALKLDTELKMGHNQTHEKFVIHSIWQNDPLRKILDGSIVFVTPFNGYKTGALSTKLSINKPKRLNGAANLIVENKPFEITLEGYARKITDIMLVINITTPIEKFGKITGQFGINEHDRHFVAVVRTPDRAIGIELLYSIISIADFNVKFHLETPIEAIEKILMIGKYNTEMVEFKGGWNKILLGYVGVWRMAGITDFEYSYKVFTPLENLTETGFVAKFVKKDELDMELSLKFSRHKVGIVLTGKPKAKLLRHLRLHQRDSVASQLLDEKQLFKQFELDGNENVNNSTVIDEADEEPDDLLNIVGHMELDILIWPTILGTLDIQEHEDTYFATGTVKLPHGNIVFDDIFFMPDVINAKNSLHIVTPFKVLNELKSVYIHSIEPYVFNIFDLEIFGLYNGNWVQVGTCLNYTNNTEEVELRSHDLLIGVLTPIPGIPTIYLKGNVELEDNIYRGNLSASTKETSLSFGASLEYDENFIDASFGLALDTPLVPKYGCKVYFKKDLSEIENTLEIGFDVRDNGTFNMLRFETTWHSENPNYLRCNAKLHTNIIPITLTELMILITKNPTPIASLKFAYTVASKSMEFYCKATRKAEAVTIEIKTPINGLQAVSLQGSINSKSTSGSYYLLGNVYKNDEVYHVEGDIILKSDIPVDIQLKLRSLNKDTLAFITYRLKDTEGGYGKTIQLKAIENHNFIQVGGGYSIFNKFDWRILITIQTSDGILSEMTGKNRIDINATVAPNDRGKVIGSFEFTSPWSNVGVDSVKLGTEFLVLSTTGEMHASYELSQMNGKSSCSWTWIPLKNMQINVDNVAVKFGSQPKILKAGFKYIRDNETSIGTLLNVDSIWHLESNGTLMIKSMNAAKFGFSILLPPPFGVVHKLNGQYESLYDFSNPHADISYEAKYETEKTHIGSRGFYKNITDLEALVHVDWGQGIREDVVETNILMQRKGIRRELSARVATPGFVEDTLTVSGSYDVRDIFNLFAGRIYYPSSRQVANGEIEFASLANMKGNVNCTTPIANLTWLRGDFDFTTTGTNAIRYFKATWPRDSAFFNLQSSFESDNLNRDLQGTIKIEVPLATRHYTSIDYSLKERQQVTTGHCVIDFNKKSVLNGMYTSRTESSAGYEKEIVDISLENELKSIGIAYVHTYDQTGSDAYIYDYRRAEVFELQKSKAFNITTELHITTYQTGQAYKIVAIHPNRTVIITSDYDFQENVTIQRSKLQLAPNVWLAYNIKIENFTTFDNDSQSFNVQLSYPKRNLSTEGSYAITDKTFDSDLIFRWTVDKIVNDWDYNDEKQTLPDEKIIRTTFKWQQDTHPEIYETNHRAQFSIKHPSFPKDISLHALYQKNLINLLKTKILVDYCDDPDHLLTFEIIAQDLMSIVNYRNYSLDIFGEHNISELDLGVHSSIASRAGLYEMYSNSRYKRGYLPLQEGSLDGFLNFRVNEIYYKKVTPHKTLMVWLKTGKTYPIYTINGSFEDSPDINSTGRFQINIDEKLVKLDVNMTPDASQNVQMLGYIADARNAFFDLYRNYEDIRVVDVSYFLRMNHSRLVTSQLIWRPKIKSEIKAKIKGAVTSVYDSMSENIDFWIKTTYTETIDTFNDIWTNAKPNVQVFLDDIEGLKIIEEDIKEFKIFLNQSYEANDFYIKTMVNFTMNILDELAIRNHIHSVPKILTEIWQSLGDSGQALHQNIVRLIENIKMSYKKAVDFITKIFHGEALENLSILMEKAVTKYDKFMKDLHLSLIKYVENVWNRITDSLMNYWKNFLRRIEPSIVKIAQYLESVLWNISNEIFDFLYKRTNEIVESPYFNTVANFTHDLDRLYTDIASNDAITNIKKYTGLAFEFLKEEYFKIVPFGKEMHHVITDVIEEIKTLETLEPVHFIIQRYNEIKNKIEWLANEFQLESRVEKLWEIFKRKITRITQTALEMDDKYREAKTKFIFDPDTGVIELEQKLPMSWHAFNETPRFDEIPEYKMIAEIQTIFSVSNYSFWTMYHDIKPYMNLNLWLPPFKTSSLLYGSRHFMTFDKRFISLNSKYTFLEPNKKPNQCSYLLAHDYVDSNFTFIIEPAITKHDSELVASKNLALIIDGVNVEINIVGSTIRIGNTQSATLPIRIGDATVYRDANALIIESNKGFQLTCNIQFDFCWFELSGWYFAKTAGILGNMNNEKYDDYLTPASIQCTNDRELLTSWTINNCTTSHDLIENTIENNSSMEVISICDSFFKSKISSFADCFGIVNPKEFYRICLDLGMNSLSNLINTIHSTQMGTCTAAVSYIETCALEGTPLRIPSTCLYCQLVNGTYVAEGKFIKFTGPDVPQTTDVVFIIEAKPCNRNFTIAKSMTTIITNLEKEFIDANLTNNRYAVVAFGGSAPFDKPRSIIYNTEIFTNHLNIKYFFDHIQTNASNNSDIFEAISFAFKLVFRPGASKTFILLPCTACNASSMKLDYSSMLQVLLEEGISLHVLMDDEFVLDKKRTERILFGLDRDNAYTKRYLKDTKGDKDLRRQVRLPKNTLGLCTPLALESNGTVFTAKKLRPGSRHPIKKVAATFAKRVAATAKPSKCQLCECSGHNSGMAFMACTHCHFPNPTSLDYGYNEEEMLKIMQTDTDFSWEWTDDDEDSLL